MSERWEPKYGDTYYFVYANGDIANNTWIKGITDTRLFKFGNVFRSAAKAEIASKKIKMWLLSLQDNDENLQDNDVTLQDNDVTLPDWCKPGAWVFDKAINKYSQITTEDITEHLQEVCKIISKGEIVPARLRPYNAEEMKNLVGKIIVNKKTKDINFVTDYINEVDEDDPSYHYCTVYVGGENMVAGDLLEDFTLDGYPCGQFERKDDCDDNF